MQPRQKLFLAVLACILGLLVGTALVLTVGSSKAKAQTAAKVTLNPEISVGGALTNDHVSGLADLSQSGFLFGVGAGVGVQTNAFIIEPFGRYSYMHENGTIGSSSLLTSNLVEAGARLGVRLTKSTDVYGIVGYAWEDLKLPASLGNKSPEGLMLGGGIEHSLNGSPLFVRAEYTHDFFDSQPLGISTKVTPDMNVVRLGLTYKFGTGYSAPNVFDTSKLAPEAEGCDPKMMNCHPMK